MSVANGKADRGSFLRSALAVIVQLTVAAAAFYGGGRNQYIEIIRPVLTPSEGGEPGTGIQLEYPAATLNIQAYTPVEEGPRKRAAIVIDKLMYALQKALDGKDKTAPRVDAFATVPNIQRRGTGDGRLYWRCYFNAVSCF